MARTKKIETIGNDYIKSAVSTPKVSKVRKTNKSTKAALTVATNNIPAGRYSREPQFVASRLLQKSTYLVTQAEIAYGRAIKVGDKVLAKKFQGFINTMKKASSTLSV